MTPLDQLKESFRLFCESRTLKDFDKIVQITHQDGSVFVLHHASLWKSNETMFMLDGCEVPTLIGVSTEHNGDFLFHGGDLQGWWVR